MEYHKIYNLFERSPDTRLLIEGQWSRPEFEVLKDLCWVWDEKVDGTNIRVMWDGETVKFGGKTDSAQIFAPLYEVLSTKFPKDLLSTVFKGPAVIYGEGYGAKIQKGGGNYKPDGVDIVVFDIRCGATWLERGHVRGLCDDLKVNMVPHVGFGSLEEAVTCVKEGLKSRWGDFNMEGLVVRPVIELQDRHGHRIIGKIKGRDFHVEN